MEMTTLDELEQIRARHEAEEAHPILEVTERPGWYIQVALKAHTDRATLLRLLDAARKELREVREAAGPFADFEHAMRQSYAEWADENEFYRFGETSLRLGHFRRLAAALAKDAPT